MSKFHKADTLSMILSNLQGIAEEVDLSEDTRKINGVPAQERLEQQLGRIEKYVYDLACIDRELGPVGETRKIGEGGIKFIWPEDAPFGPHLKVLEEKYGRVPFLRHQRSPLVEGVSALVGGLHESKCGEWRVTGWRVADLRNPGDESEILLTLTNRSTGVEDVLTLTCEDGVIYWEDFSHKTPVASYIGESEPLRANSEGESVYSQLDFFVRDIPAVYANRVRRGVA